MAKSLLVLVALAALVAGALAQTATPILISANPDAGSGSAAPFTDLLAAVKKNPALSELLKLVQANGLADELAAFNGTLFAPSNDAIAAFIKKFANVTGHDFNKDGKVDIDDLDEKYDLANIILEHLVPQAVAYSQIFDKKVFTTALGEAFNVSFVNGTATLRADQGTSAHIVKAVSALGEDVKLGNGAILHVIDALLLPSVEASSITVVPAPAPSIAKSPSAAKAAVDAAKEKLGNGAAQASAPAAALLAVALTMLLA